MSQLDELRIVLRDNEPAIIEQYFNEIQVGSRKIMPTELAMSMLEMLEDEEIVAHLLRSNTLFDVFNNFLYQDKWNDNEFEEDAIKILALFLDYMENADDQSIVVGILKTVAWHFDAYALDEESFQAILGNLMNRVHVLPTELAGNVFYTLLDQIGLLEEKSDEFVSKVLKKILNYAQKDAATQQLIHQLFKVTAEKAKKQWILDVLRPYMSNRKVCTSPLLPKHCFVYQELLDGTKIVGVEVEKQRFDVNYHRHFFEQVGHPKLIFLFYVQGQKVSNVLIAAVKDTVIDTSTVLYRYPFSNVFGNMSACWPDLSRLVIKDITKLGSLPYLFLNSPSNDHLFTGQNLGEWYFRLQHQDFDDEDLIPTESTIADFLELSE